MTREEWLQHAVELLNRELFGGDIDLDMHPYQIAVGWTASKKAMGETIQPADNGALSDDTFFPTTIHINCTVREPEDILGVLAHEMIHAFYNIKGHRKDFVKHAKAIGFAGPYTQYNPTDDMKLRLKELYQTMIDDYGRYPGKPVYIAEKEKKEGKKSTFIAFCPECGYEIKVTKKTLEKFNHELPTCACGAKMAIDNPDEEENNDE